MVLGAFVLLAADSGALTEAPRVHLPAKPSLALGFLRVDDLPDSELRPIANHFNRNVKSLAKSLRRLVDASWTRNWKSADFAVRELKLDRGVGGLELEGEFRGRDGTVGVSRLIRCAHCSATGTNTYVHARHMLYAFMESTLLDPRTGAFSQIRITDCRRLPKRQVELGLTWHSGPGIGARMEYDLCFRQAGIDDREYCDSHSPRLFYKGGSPCGTDVPTCRVARFQLDFDLTENKELSRLCQGEGDAREAWLHRHFPGFPTHQPVALVNAPRPSLESE